MQNASSPEPLLKVRGLTAGFGAGPVLFGIDLDVAPAELVALVGANGAGKSTLLGVLSGLVPAAAGTDILSGAQVTNEHAVGLWDDGDTDVHNDCHAFRNLITLQKVL